MDDGMEIGSEEMFDYILFLGCTGAVFGAIKQL